jgi:tetratricopeptide (TPR) repeat protein
LAQVSSEKQIERYLQDAQAAEKKQDYASAVAAYQNVLKIRPKWALVHQSLGVVYHLQSRYPEAISALKHALKLDPALWGSYLFLGMDYYRTNQFLKAIPALEQAIKLNPKLAEAEARLWLGNSLQALERFDEAVPQFRRLAEIKPREVEALYNLAQVYNRFASALFRRISQLEPESAEAHRLQGEWFEWQNKPGEAIGEYAKVVKSRPDWEDMHRAIGNLYLKNGDTANALRALEAELQLAPEDEGLLQLLSRLKETSAGEKTSPASSAAPTPATAAAGPAARGQHASLSAQGIERFRARDYAAARELLGRAVQRDPQDAQAPIYLARCEFALGHYEQAIEVLRGLDDRHRFKLEALYWAGKAYQELAAATLEKMIDIDPASYRVHQMSGEILEEKTRYAEALAAYQTALKKFPELTGIRFAIGNVYWKMQQLDEALASLKDELARNPYHALANYRVGSIYVSKGNTGIAIPFLERAVQANPGMLVAQQELAKAFLSQGRNAEAIERLIAVAKADPEDESVHYLLAGAYKKIGKPEAAEAELKIFTRLRAEKSRQRQEYLRQRISPGPASEAQQASP